MRTLWSRYKCPNCKADLKTDPPKPAKIPWYKLVSRYPLQCPACAAELERRFADLDLGLAALFTSGGSLSIWGFGKAVLPAVAALVAMRIIAGRLLPVYVLSKK